MRIGKTKGIWALAPPEPASASSLPPPHRCNRCAVSTSFQRCWAVQTRLVIQGISLQAYILQGREGMYGNGVNRVLRHARPYPHQGTKVHNGGKHDTLHG